MIVFTRATVALVLIAAPLTLYARPCEPTKSMSPGANYQVVTRQQANIGKGLRISGVVRAARDCGPIAGARVVHWQANNQGEFTEEMRAYLFADHKGQYTFSTEWPGGDVPRIHFMVVAPGYKTLFTQWIGDEKTQSSVLNLILETAPAKPVDNLPVR
jgi:protocatechuate 3,4-dioxygenase beta subunit